MKYLSKFAALLASCSILALTAFGAVPAFADSPGQLEGGTADYVVRDMTTNSSYASTISANACDELQYSIRLHNISYGGFTAINVQVNLPSATSTANTSSFVATTNLGGTSGTNGTATVNLSSAQSISYINGSATLYNSSGNVIETLPSSLFTSGVNIGGLNGSTTEFVNFEAKVNCPQTPPAPVYTCNLLNVSETGDRQITANVQYTATNGAAFSSVTYNFGDNSTINVANAGNVQHSYANYGTYKVTASLLFSVNGSNQTVSSANCVKTISFTAPNTPSQLVNTGPGSVVGIFAGTAVIATAAHYLFRRRLAKRSV